MMNKWMGFGRGDVNNDDAINLAEGVTLILNYLVAYQILHRVAQVKAGDKVLIVGASGGVGTAFLQLGKLAGLKMYGLASAGKHLEVVETPYKIALAELDRGFNPQTAYAIVSIDIADIDVGENIGARLQADQAEADTRVARAKGSVATSCTPPVMIIRTCVGVSTVSKIATSSQTP